MITEHLSLKSQLDAKWLCSWFVCQLFSKKMSWLGTELCPVWTFNGTFVLSLTCEFVEPAKRVSYSSAAFCYLALQQL